MAPCTKTSQFFTVLINSCIAPPMEHCINTFSFNIWYLRTSFWPHGNIWYYIYHSPGSTQHYLVVLTCLYKLYKYLWLSRKVPLLYITVISKWSFLTQHTFWYLHFFEEDHDISGAMISSVPTLHIDTQTMSYHTDLNVQFSILKRCVHIAWRNFLNSDSTGVFMATT